MGRADPPRGLDTGGGSTHNHNVRQSSDANPVPQAVVGEDSAAGLLRGKCVAAA